MCMAMCLTSMCTYECRMFAILRHEGHAASYCASFFCASGAQDAAAAAMLAPDLFFCMELLKATGIVGVAGSGFGQREGTFHVRICILPDEALLTEMIQKFKTFYMKFVERYKD